MTEIRALANAVPDTEDWIADFRQRLGWHDEHRVYLALIAALHALRDALPRDEAIHLGAYLPSLLRGLYYEGWHPSGRMPLKSRELLLERIHDGVHRAPGIDPDHVVRTMFALLVARMPAAEIEDVRAATPRSLHPFWPS